MFRQRHLSFLLLACAIFLLDGRVAQACSCARTPSVLDSYESADHVVIARAVAVEKTEKAAPEGQMSDGTNYVNGVKSTTMVVEKAYKGKLKVGDEMIFAQGGGADCIWTFEENDIGSKYLFYLNQPEEGSVWIAVTCGRSRGVDYANDDLLYLNNLNKVKGRTRVSGTLSFEGSDAPDIAGRKIRLVGAGKTYEARTDEHGVYEIYDVPAGKYFVEPETPHGWRVANFWLGYSPSFAGNEAVKSPTKIPIIVEARKHAGLDLRFEVDNAIRGKIYDTSGKPLNGVCLSLMPATGEVPRYFYKADCTEKGGAFEIDEIPPGSYVIVVNDDGKVSSSEPFGTFYYPNVSKREEATVFHIGAGDFLENIQIYAPRMEETITVEGIFLYSDGKPVADERVKFEAEKSGVGEDANARANTDTKGRFSIKILKGQRGRLHGEMYSYIGEFENCPKLESVIKQTGNSNATVKTPALEIHAANNLHGIELRYPFPSCKKAKIE